MANYRPKSLDELNNLYGKSLNARNEIDKKASVLDAENEKQEAAFLPEEAETSKEKTPEQVASDEISGLVGDFVKSFGKTSNIKKNKVSNVPLTGIKSISKNESSETATDDAPADNKPKLIRNSERNNLFENYKKVMDDEDDYDFGENKKSKKRGKKRSDKNADEEASSEVKDKPTLISDKKVPEIKGKLISEETSVSDIEEENEITGANKPPKAKVALMAIVLVMLILTSAVGAVKAFSGINTNKLTAGKYRIFTSSADYNALGIGKGDLVIVEHKAVNNGDIVAYEKSANSFDFTKFDSPLNNDCSVSDNGNGQKGVIYNNSIRGVFYTSIPFVGTIASFIISDFTILVAVLCAIILVLSAVLIFSFKNKDNTEKVKEEKPVKEKTVKEKKEKKKKKEKPEKVKKEKKSRKSKVIEEETDEDENAYEESDEDYDSIDEDFRYLLAEEDEEYEDEFDAYRDKAEEETEITEEAENYEEASDDKYTIADDE